MPRVRPAPAVAALATALALAATGPVVPGPAAAAPAASVHDAERLLAAVEQRVGELAAELTAHARAYEDGQGRLGVAQARAVAADRAVEQAEAAAGDAGAAVREAVRVRYRNPTPAGLQVLIELQAGRLGDALAVRTALARAQQQAERDSDAAVDAAAASVQVRAEAEVARAQVVALGNEQDEQLRVLQDEAAAAEQELTAAVARLHEVQEADRRAREAAAARARAEQARADQQRAEQARAARRVAELTGLSGPVAVPYAGAGCSATGPLRAANGLLPDAALCALQTAPGHRLVPAAAAAFDALSRAHQAATGRPLCLTDSYRDYPAQVDVFRRKPGLAAVPGTSNHGWGRAVDLCGGVERFGTDAHRWLQANGPRFGWTHPAWAQAGGSRPEAWHWEHAGR